MLRLGGTDRQSFGHCHTDDVGQVVFLLRVVVRQAPEPCGQVGRRHGHDAGIDLADIALRSGRILLLDDAHDLASRIAHHAPVTRRIGQFDGQDGQRIMRGIKQAPECFNTGQRHVTIEDQRCPALGQMRQGLLHGVSGAQLWFLQGPGQVGSVQRTAHDITTVPINQTEFLRVQAARRVNHMGDQGFARQRMKHLGQTGMHALSLSGGEDDDIHKAERNNE